MIISGREEDESFEINSLSIKDRYFIFTNLKRGLRYENFTCYRL
jgi:hypothetical protein